MDSIAVIDLLRAEGLLEARCAPQVTPLAGGYWNQVWRLVATSRDWVVKVFDHRPERRLFPILFSNCSEADGYLRRKYRKGWNVAQF